MERHLTHPPIVEAIWDFRVDLPTEVSVSSIEGMYPQIQNRYPQKQTIYQWSGGFKLEIGKDPQPQGKGAVLGYAFKSGDGKDAVQFRLDGFSFSRIGNYVGWKELLPAVKKEWEFYRNNAAPIRVKKLAVRTINSIEIPAASFPLERFLKSPPQLPPSLPQNLGQLFLRMEVPFEDRSVRAVITQEIQPTPKPGSSRIVFDTDVSIMVSFIPNDEEIWNAFERLRETKNDIFFESFTDESLAPYR